MRKRTQMNGTAGGSTGESSAAARSGISRRGFLVGTAALGLGLAAATLPILRAQPALAANTGRAFFGCNQDVYNQIKYGLDDNGIPDPGAIAVPDLKGIRMYDTKPTGDNTVIPRSSWPKGPSFGVPYSGPIVFSIYPNPNDVLDGGPSFDAIRSLIASAPANSYLAAWHEGLYLPHPDYISTGSLSALHTVLNGMCQGTNVTYGAILADPETWDSVPNNLGFYGLDIYASNFTGQAAIDDGTTRLDSWIHNARQHFTSDPNLCPPGTAPNYPNLLIGETNMPPASGNTSYRGLWFEAVCGRMHTYGTNNIGVLTFWRAGGTLGGPWRPEDHTTELHMITCTDSIF